jgi:hypothetical protein
VHGRAKEDQVLSYVRRAVTLVAVATTAVVPIVITITEGAKRWA